VEREAGVPIRVLRRDAHPGPRGRHRQPRRLGGEAEPGSVALPRDRDPAAVAADQYAARAEEDGILADGVGERDLLEPELVTLVGECRSGEREQGPRAGRVGEGVPEPDVLARAVVRDDVDDDAQPEAVRVRDERVDSASVPKRGSTSTESETS
jgi:hypothetical protein